MSYHRINVNINELINGAPTLVLDADAASGAGTITVKSIIGAADKKILLFRQPGSELAEIGSINGSPSGNTITLLSNLTESHPAGTTVYIISFNQVRFYHSATEVDANVSDLTLTALAAAQDIDPTQIVNFYNDAVQTSGYYYFRFSDSVNTVNDRYSDAIPWGAKEGKFARNQVGYLLDYVSKKLDHNWDERFSRDTALDEINECLSYIQGKLKRWSRYLVSNYSLGQTARGSFEFTLPSDIYDATSNRSILQIRIGGMIDPLTWLDEKEFDQVISGVKMSPLRTQAVATDVTLDVDNSYDFDDDGTLHIYTAGTLDEITYTGATRSATAGQFTGVPATGDGAIGATHAVDTLVWQDEVESMPKYWTIKNGKVYIYPLPDETWENKNVEIDCTREATQVDSESDTIDTNRYDMCKHWLLWQGKTYWKNNGKVDVKDDDFLIFNDILKSAIRTTTSGQKFKMTPKINQISYRTRRRYPFNVE